MTRRWPCLGSSYTPFEKINSIQNITKQKHNILPSNRPRRAEDGWLKTSITFHSCNVASSHVCQVTLANDAKTVEAIRDIVKQDP